MDNKKDNLGKEDQQVFNKIKDLAQKNIEKWAVHSTHF